MRIKGKFFVFLLSCFICVVYNTIVKILFWHPTEQANLPSHVIRRLGNAESFASDENDRSLLEKCKDNDPTKCQQLIFQSLSDVEIQIEKEIPEYNTSEKETFLHLDASYLIPSENFVIEPGSTPKNYVDIPKINGSHPAHPKDEDGKAPKLNFFLRKPATEKLFPKINALSPKQLVERARRSNNSELIKFIETQDARKSHESAYCSQTFNSKNFEKLKQTGFQNVIIDREFSLSFCPIYKAASTSWLANLLKLNGMWKSNKHNKKTQMLVNQVFQKVSNIAAPWMSKGTTRFMIVRHPFHRLISCYRDKYKDASKLYYYQLYGEKMVQLFRPRPKGATREEIRLMVNAVRRVMNSRSDMALPGNPYANPLGPTFEEFVKYILSTKHDDDHWRPYYQQCSLCHINYDFVLRFENIENDSNIFVEYLNLTNVIKTGWENPTSEGSTTDDVACKYFKEINSKLFMDLTIKYKHDFNLFNYTPDKYLKCVNDYRSSIT